MIFVRFFKYPELLILAILGVSFTGCVGAPEPEKVPQQVRLRRDNSEGSKLSFFFEQQLSFYPNQSGISVYFRKIAERLTMPNVNLASSPIGVLLIKDKEKSPWRSYSLAGNRIYLSVGAATLAEFESELAASISYQLGHLLSRHVLDRLEKDSESPRIESKIEGVTPFDSGVEKSSVAFLGPAGVFAYTEEEHLEAVRRGVEVLHGAGYDVRGMSAWLGRFKLVPEKSPFEAVVLDKMIEVAKEVGALKTPLRNPTLQTSDFLGIRKRVKEL